MSRLAFVLMLFVACGRKDGEECESAHQCKSDHCVAKRCTTGNVKAPCKTDFDCDDDDGFHCFAERCRLLGRDGDHCSVDSDCTKALKCGDNRCLPPERAAEADTAAAVRRVAAAEKEEVEKEKRLLVESGVVATAEAEHVINSPGPGSRVRVVTTTADGSSFAACRADERLISGGCRAQMDMQGSFPSGHGGEDTVGARWNCTTQGGIPITAYALCTKLAD